MILNIFYEYFIPNVATKLAPAVERAAPIKIAEIILLMTTNENKYTLNKYKKVLVFASHHLKETHLYLAFLSTINKEFSI